MQAQTSVVSPDGGEGDPFAELSALDAATALNYSPDQLATLWKARAQLVVACMASHDLPISWQTPDADAFAAENQWQLDSVRFDNLDRIRNEGYAAGAPFVAVDDWPVMADEAGERILKGDGDAQAGCFGEADDAIFGAGQAAFAVPGDPQTTRDMQDARNEAAASIDIGPAAERWADCMADDGQSVTSFEASVRERIGTPDRFSSDSAVIDSECRQSSGLQEVLMQRRAAGAQLWMDAHPDVVESTREFHARVVDRAERLLS